MNVYVYVRRQTPPWYSSIQLGEISASLLSYEVLGSLDPWDPQSLKAQEL